MTGRPFWATAAVGIAAVGLAAYGPARPLAHRFIVSMRIARPQPVAAAAPSFSGANASRQLVAAVGGMLTATVNTTLDEADQPSANAGAAAKVAGFAPQLPRARTDPASLTVAGAHTVQMVVSRATLRTILTQAGVSKLAVPASLDGANVTISTPRLVRARYGNCPVPPPATLQGQLQSPPPVTADNGNCVILTEGPPVTATTPDGLDVDTLVEIALQLAGMSPNQATALRRMMDWESTLVLALPRGIRSYDTVAVGDATGMLITTVGRRGPTYALVWAHKGMVFTLTGYGSPADARAIAGSVQ